MGPGYLLIASRMDLEFSRLSRLGSGRLGSGRVGSGRGPPGEAERGTEPERSRSNLQVIAAVTGLGSTPHRELSSA